MGRDWGGTEMLLGFEKTGGIGVSVVTSLQGAFPRCASVETHVTYIGQTHICWLWLRSLAGMGFVLLSNSALQRSSQFLLFESLSKLQS